MREVAMVFIRNQMPLRLLAHACGSGAGFEPEPAATKKMDQFQLSVTRGITIRYSTPLGAKLGFKGTSLYNSEFANYTLRTFLDSIVVSISACHADDPGSIPGRGVYT